jgi:hypothetical protein
MIPWQAVGQSAAEQVRLALAGAAIAGKRCVIDPLTVMGAGPRIYLRRTTRW